MTLRQLAFSTLVLFTPSFTFAQTAAPAPAPAPAPTETPAPAPATTPAPAPAPADTTPAAPTERPSTYTIAQGDSLWTIAHKFSTTVVQLRKLNKLKKGALLHPGQTLQIPPATPAK